LYLPSKKCSAVPTEKTGVIVTANLPFERWTEVLGNERLVGATLDRFLDERLAREKKGWLRWPHCEDAGDELVERGEGRLTANEV
jgi:hypothetical protein